MPVSDHPRRSACRGSDGEWTVRRAAEVRLRGGQAYILAALAAVSVGCGEARRYGDPGGMPVSFTVQVEKPFFDNLADHRVQPSVGVGAGFSSGGGSFLGSGIGLTFTTTQVYLLGGAAPGQADVFRQELSWGDNRFTVPLLPQRTLVLTVQAEGGREGWESIGTIQVPNDPHADVHIVLDAKGARIIAGPVPVPAADAPAPATTPAPAALAPAK